MGVALRLLGPGGEWPSLAGQQPGDMWRWPRLDRDGREAWVVVLPNGQHWHTCETYGGVMWDVTGEPPHITVTPAVSGSSAGRGWHGWIRDGELTEAG